jgi:hypothetical protein
MVRNLTAGILSILIFLVSEKDVFFLVEGLLLFAIGVLIPLSFPLVNDIDRNGRKQPLMVWIQRVYFLAPISSALALLLNVKAFYAVWIIITLLLAFAAAARVLERGIHILEETSIDSAYLYLPLGSLWLLAYGMNLEVAGFSGIIVLLTAIHFHYSSFAIPLFAGLLKRRSPGTRKLHDFILIIVMISPMTIAIGITYSDFIEFTAVAMYTASLFIYAFLAFKTKWTSQSGKVLTLLSATILMITISFSIIYSFGAVTPYRTLTIPEMIYLHGMTNAIGVCLLGLIGWNIENPKPVYNHLGKPFSNIRGLKVIGLNFLQENGLENTNVYNGLSDDMSEYGSGHFDPNELSPLISDFYENTGYFELKAVITWRKWFSPLAAVYSLFSRKTGQIHLGRGGKEETMEGELIGVRDEIDGRTGVRAWRRTNENGEPIFLALYSRHRFSEETYMNIALPLPYSTMTGILKAENMERGLLLTSRLRKSRRGDEGIYLTVFKVTIRLPLSESFVVQESSADTLTAKHQMWIFGIPFLVIEYRIRKAY